jgi:hypothetical protein
MKYRIVKEIDAKSITDAIKKEKKGEIIYVEKEEKQEPEPRDIGFKK